MSENPTLEKAKECTEQLSYNWTAIDVCTNGELGYKSVSNFLLQSCNPYRTITLSSALSLSIDWT